MNDYKKFIDELLTLPNDQLSAVGAALKEKIDLRIQNGLLQEHLWKVVRAVGRLLDDKFSEGDEAVRNQLWRDMHRSVDKAREYLENIQGRGSHTEAGE